MAKHKIKSVSLSKTTVKTGEQLTIKVGVIDWNYVKKFNSTWATVKSSYKKWGDLVG